MPLLERRMRWEAMMAKLRAGTIQEWFAGFVRALQDSHALNDPAQNDNVPAATPAVWPVHSVASTAVTSRLH
jgi:trehalose 6-phosphate synthase